MLDILFVILPVFIVLGAGYTAVATGYLNAAISDHLNAFAVRLAVPALLFNAMAGLDLGQAFVWPMLIAFYSGALASFVLASLAARFIWKRRPGEAVAIGFTATFSNTVLLGLPIIERAFGASVLTPAFGIIALHASLIYILGITAMELSRRDGRSLPETVSETARAIFANPLMIAILAGLAFNATGIAMPDPLQSALDLLTAAAIPAALVGIGAAMTRYQLKAEMAESMMIAVISLLIHPLIAFGLAYGAFGLSAENIRAAVILAAMPPGLNGYIFASMYNRAMATSASAILIATALSILTIAGWLLLLG